MISVIEEIEDRGDQAFMLWLYQEFSPLICSTARKYVPGREKYEDIIQEALLRLIEKVSVLRSMERYTLVYYVSVTVKNTALNYLRKQKAIDKHCVPWGGSGDGIAAGAPDLEEAIMLKELANRLRGIWGRLTEEERCLLEGKYLLEQNDRELARQLNCQPGSVRMKLTRARRRARQLMTEEGVKHNDKA